MKTSIILSTYNQPAWLEKAFIGFSNQTSTDFELVVADDGSGEETRRLIADFAQWAPFQLIHSWQEDDGFRKTAALNGAIRASRGDYLIFTDGDCVPRADFVATHQGYAEPGRYLSGGYVKLPRALSEAITPYDIESGNMFELRWLIKNGMRNFKRMKKIWTPSIANHLYSPRLTWSGNNASTWRRDIYAVNGFNETMGYMLEDIEFGVRLENYGLRPRQIRYSAIVCHLYHDHPYRNEAAAERHRNMVSELRVSGERWTDSGLKRTGRTQN